jgi:hypothetical protein
MSILTQNSNALEFVKFHKKIQIFHIQIGVVILKMTSCETMSRRKKSENPTFYGQNNLLFWHLAI